jgi:hypothetical protein
MRRMAILVAGLAGLSLVGAPPAAAQLPETPLPETQVPLPDVPEVELPELPGGGGGGGSGGGGGGGVGGIPVPTIDTPSIGGGSGGGSGGGGGGAGGGGGGSGGDSGDGRSGRSGGGQRTGSSSCPCAAPATGSPVAGDYDKCPAGGDASGGNGGQAPETAASEGAGLTAGGVLSAEAGSADTPGGGPEDYGLLSPSGVADSSPAGLALLGLAAIVLLVGVAGTLRALHGRLRGG